MYDKLIEGKLAACKKCCQKPYFALSFELPQPSDSDYSTEDYDSYHSKLRISEDTTIDIIIDTYLNSISEPELMALKKGALYSLHSELYHVDYNPLYRHTTLSFKLKSLKSIEIIE